MYWLFCSVCYSTPRETGLAEFKLPLSKKCVEAWIPTKQSFASSFTLRFWFKFWRKLNHTRKHFWRKKISSKKRSNWKNLAFLLRSKNPKNIFWSFKNIAIFFQTSFQAPNHRENFSAFKMCHLHRFFKLQQNSEQTKVVGVGDGSSDELLKWSQIFPPHCPWVMAEST